MLLKPFNGLAIALVLIVLGCAGPERSTRGRPSRSWPDSVVLGTLPSQGDTPPCGSRTVPPGWPDLSSSQDVLIPFLQCTSPAEFIELQRGVDMAGLVEQLEDWSAVRLGTLGPLRAGASILNRKRAAFLVTATREYGVARAEVFALFIVLSAFTDDVHEVLVLLAQDKQLGQTLGRMGAVREALLRRGLNLTDYADRAERTGDVVRGLATAATEALSTSELRRGAVALKYATQRGQLPSPFQQVLDAVESAEMKAAFAPESVAVGTFDALTLGVPLGFYNLLAGTCHGVYSLSQGQYEQATRELSAAAVLVGLYAGGKAVRFVSDGSAGVGWTRVRRIPVPELGFEGLAAVAERVWTQLGGEGMRQLARYIQANREAALLVYERGEPGAIALYEARGNVAKAQAWLTEAKPERPAPTRSVAPSKGALSTDTPIRNAHLAGKKHPVTGVPFDADGYPDFRAARVVQAEVRITYTGSRMVDFAAANKAAGLRETPKGMTWHHHQDRTTMQLVPTDIHAKTGHTGGFTGGK
jgi:hypothetical protein